MKKLFRSHYLKLGLAIALLAGGWWLHRSTFLQPDTGDLAARFQRTLHQKEAALQQELALLEKEALSGNPEKLFTGRQAEKLLPWEKQGFYFYIYEGDTLRFWSSNAVSVDAVWNTSSFHSRVIRMKDGWYEVFQKKAGAFRLVGLLLLKNSYPYQNKYLVNAFPPDYNLPGEAVLTFASTPHAQPVSASDGEVLFSLQLQQRPDLPGNRMAALAVANAIALLLLVLFVRQQCLGRQGHIGKNNAVLLYVFLLGGLRALSLYFNFPTMFRELGLFDPGHYAASAVFPSLGDLLINVMLLTYMAYVLHSEVQPGKGLLERAARWVRCLLTTLIFSATYFFADFCEHSIEGLVEDSNISFNMNNLFELNVYSYVGILTLGMLFFGFFLVADKTVLVVRSVKLAPGLKMLFFLLVTTAFAIHGQYENHSPVSHTLWPAAIFAVIYLFRSRKEKGYSFASTIALITLFSFFAAFLLSQYTAKRELGHRKVLAEKLSTDEDPVAELLYAEMEPQILEDERILFELSRLDSMDKEMIDKRFSEQYFTGYFSRFEVRSFIFKGDGTPVLPSNPDQRKHSRQYFEELLHHHAQPTLSGNFFHIHNAEEKESYIAKISLQDEATGQEAGVMYIAFESKLVPEEIGFPELLLEGDNRLHGELSNYSFASYRNGQLVKQFGNYPYSLGTAGFLATTGKFTQQEENGFSHLLYAVEPGLLVVLTKTQEGVLGKITTFSYLFAFFSLLLLVALVLRNFARGFALTKLNFNNKIQFLLVAVIITSLVLFGLGTSYYINKQSKEKNYKNIIEKINSVLIEVDKKLGGQPALDEGIKDYMHHMLSRFSSVFFTDINLYDLQGNLLASSRPQLFSEGIISRKMNPTAFSEMALRQKSSFVHEEQIGLLNYLSAYIPFKNKEGKVLAWLNLPYFAKQDTLEREISSFMVALINIYVFLFMISVVAALLISNFITKPLRLIQNTIGKLELGKSNEPIQYEGRDELGTLVAVYNEKVAELQRSAELLARSERESAWREMAKQVAHEIKNPLTPMKLSVQQLERSWDDKDPRWEEKLHRFTKTIIEQIDTLSHIASEFSNFAKMPRARNERISLHALLESEIELFRETPAVALRFTSQADGDPHVFADKEQLIRVFNNLIKNAIQAIPEGREGEIIIWLNTTRESVFIEVQDNGTGISPEQTDQIFVPSFTSKTGGMGLGLAMVKNIVENAGGSIGFESTLGEGTTFRVELPLHQG